MKPFLLPTVFGESVQVWRGRFNGYFGILSRWEEVGRSRGRAEEEVEDPAEETPTPGCLEDNTIFCVMANEPIILNVYDMVRKLTCVKYMCVCSDMYCILIHRLTTFMWVSSSFKNESAFFMFYATPFGVKKNKLPSAIFPKYCYAVLLVRESRITSQGPIRTLFCRNLAVQTWEIRKPMSALFQTTQRTWNYTYKWFAVVLFCFDIPSWLFKDRYLLVSARTCTKWWKHWIVLGTVSSFFLRHGPWGNIDTYGMYNFTVLSRGICTILAWKYAILRNNGGASPDTRYIGLISALF